MKRTQTARKEWKSARPNALLTIRLKPTAGDFFLLALLFFLFLIQLVFNPPGGASSQKATVYYNGKILKHISLDYPHQETISYQGKKLMVVQVTPPSLKVVSSTCPDKLCQRQGAIFREGDTIICLPNKTVIRTLGGEDLDAVIR